MKLTYSSPEDPRAKRLLIQGIERITGVKEIQRLYDELEDIVGPTMWQAALDQLDVDVALDGFDLEQLPPTGPLVVLGNHPFGVLDGLILCALVAKMRPRFRVLVNSVLCRDERTKDYVLPIDFAPTRDAMKTNVTTKKRAIEALAGGEAIALFPSGAVATATSAFGPVVDLEWKTFVARLVRSSRATVLPLYFHGQNGRLFQIVSQVSETLRLSLLLREMKRRQGETIRVTIGEPIPYEELAEIKGREALTDFLRQSVMGLAPPPRKRRRDVA